MFKVHVLLITLSLHMINLNQIGRMEIEETPDFIVVGNSLPRNEEPVESIL